MFLALLRKAQERATMKISVIKIRVFSFCQCSATILIQHPKPHSEQKKEQNLLYSWAEFAQVCHLALPRQGKNGNRMAAVVAALPCSIVITHNDGSVKASSCRQPKLVRGNLITICGSGFPSCLLWLGLLASLR